ncbi:MAG: histidine--tRNA ligase [Candidatus Tectomicrobia bacterium]|nr:histidine--tRNA ligase [Candidatus Tectomicrobia bacterium]
MDRQRPIERVKGTLDLLPESYAQHVAVREQLSRLFASYGYRGVEPPILEHAELHLRKSGGGIISKLYTFQDFARRRLCLRPELTASVVRVYVNALRHAPLPVRLQYCGPAFRYEQPQRGRHRQFTHIGVELLGAAGPAADAEIIALACKGLQALGLRRLTVRLGHVGVMLALLTNLRLSERARSFFIESMENLGKPHLGIESIKQALHDLEIIPAGAAPAEPHNDILRPLLEARPEEAAALIERLLAMMNVQPRQSRDARQVAARLLGKMRHEEHQAQVQRAVDFLAELALIKGQPPEVFTDIGKLLEKFALPQQPLEDLQRLVETLRAYEVPEEQLSIDLSFGRGIQYYTGVIFEIQHEALGREDELCGGGRYDDLVAVLGGDEAVPACGFSFGLERLLLALEAEELPLARSEGPDLLVIPIGRAVGGEAARLAELLRGSGLRVELEIKERTLKSSLSYANKSGVPFACIVGEDELRAATVRLRNMRTREERSEPLAELGRLAATILAARQAG